MTRIDNYNKAAFRHDILKKRKNMTEAEVEAASELIINKIAGLPVYVSAQDICCYVSINNEVKLNKLIHMALKADKRVYLPKVTGDRMEFIRYESNVTLKKGKYNISEPDNDEVLIPGEKTVIFMPGAVFSRKMDRIGYGGGYYDRYLSLYPQTDTVGVCYDFQILDDIPAKEYDIKPGMIVSQSYTLCANSI